MNTGFFGNIYTQFVNKPKEAIIHLMKVKNGECEKSKGNEKPA